MTTEGPANGPTYRAAIIGVGRKLPTGTTSADAHKTIVGVTQGVGVGYYHAHGYHHHPRTHLVAAADVNEANLADFQAAYAQSPSTKVQTYTDYRELLARERPDLVSICTWPPLHCEMTVAAAEAGVQGVLCEKPMAVGLGEADRMLAACEQARAKLSINHQRRLSRRYGWARELIEQGAIGPLRLMESVIPGWDLMYLGTHAVDLFRFYNGDAPVEWVAAQVDYTPGRRRYGVRSEDFAVAYLAFANGVRGLLVVGDGRDGGYRLHGAEGLIEIGATVRARLRGERDWTVLDTPERGYDPDHFTLAIDDLIQAIEQGTEPQLGGRSGRATTEVLMAMYESAYRRGRIHLPLAASDYPLDRLAAVLGPA